MKDTETQTCGYTDSGERVEIVQLLDDGKWLVRRWLRGGDEFYLSDELVIVSRKPTTKLPESVYAADISKELERLDELHEDCLTARKEKEELAHKMRDMKQVAKTAPKNVQAVVDGIDAFLNNKITHLVELDYGPPKMRSLEEALKADDDVDRGNRRLVSLFGRTEGDLQWRLHRYSDGSGGSGVEIIPCRSRDDAVDVFWGMFAKHKATCEENSCMYDRKWVERMKEYGIAVPVDYLTGLVKYERSIAFSAAEALEGRLQKAQKKLEALDAEIIGNIHDDPELAAG